MIFLQMNRGGFPGSVASGFLYYSASQIVSATPLPQAKAFYSVGHQVQRMQHLKKTPLYTLKPLMTRLQHSKDYYNFELKLYRLYQGRISLLLSLCSYLKYSVTYIKIKLLFIHLSYYYYTHCLINQFGVKNQLKHYEITFFQQRRNGYKMIQFNI